MKLIRNLRKRRCTIALIGTGLHLGPAGSPDDSAVISDAEASDDDVVAKLDAKIIAIEPAPDNAVVVRDDAAVKARRRAEARNRSEERSRLRLTAPLSPDVTPPIITSTMSDEE